MTKDTASREGICDSRAWFPCAVAALAALAMTLALAPTAVAEAYLNYRQPCSQAQLTCVFYSGLRVSASGAAGGGVEWQWNVNAPDTNFGDYTGSLAYGSGDPTSEITYPDSSISVTYGAGGSVELDGGLFGGTLLMTGTFLAGAQGFADSYGSESFNGAFNVTYVNPALGWGPFTGGQGYLSDIVISTQDTGLLMPYFSGVGPDDGPFVADTILSFGVPPPGPPPDSTPEPPSLLLCGSGLFLVGLATLNIRKLAL